MVNKNILLYNFNLNDLLDRVSVLNRLDADGLIHPLWGQKGKMLTFIQSTGQYYHYRFLTRTSDVEKKSVIPGIWLKL